jgi:hypothetical protein
MIPDSLRAYFQEQVAIFRTYDSPFMAQLVERMAADLDQGGPVADLIGTWSGHPLADGLSVRLAGAMHAAALTARDPALTAEYPEQRADWNMDALWPIARALLARHREWFAEFIRSPPQTNEVRRSIALLPAFLSFARRCGGAMDTLEIGASAGLNLHWDRFRYRTASWRWGDGDGALIDTDWQGPPPDLSALPRVHSRAACDQNPLDIRDHAQRSRLRSYVWADQPERLARFDAAVALALASPARVERADAGEWLARKLEHVAADRGTIVYHSVFLQYPSHESRAAIAAAIEAAGERATARAPFGWLRLEADAILGGRADSPHFLVDLITWPDRTRRTIALTDGHARFVQLASD